jgi:hypothetical protein
MEVQGSQPHSAIGPYNEPNESSSHLTNNFLRIHLNIVLHLCGIFLPLFPINIVYAFFIPPTNYMLNFSHHP